MNEVFVYSSLLLIVIMLQLRPECVKPIQNLFKMNDSGTVTCIFGDHIQIEKLDETKLLPRDLMCIVHNYYDDKMIIECNSCGSCTTFNINDNDNKIVYYYDSIYEMLCVIDNKFDQKDDSIIIISSPFIFFNLSRLYYHYAINNNFSFSTKYNDGSVVINNNKYTMTFCGLTYESIILDHEILQRRIIVMKQLIDIIEKNWSV